MVTSAVSCLGVRRSESRRVPPPPTVAGSMPAFPAAAWPTRPDGVERRRPDGYVPATATAAGACRHWPRRHVPRVVGGLFDKKFRRWSFLAFHSRRWSHVSKIPDNLPSSSTNRTSSARSHRATSYFTSYT
jgi:hypothetical protein